MKKILISDPMSQEGLEFLQQQSDIEIANLPGITPDKLLEEIRDADALIVRSKTKVTEEVINSAKKLKSQTEKQANSKYQNTNLK